MNTLYLIVRNEPKINFAMKFLSTPKDLSLNINENFMFNYDCKE